MTTIHEMRQVIWVTNERLGDGVILAIMDYGAHHNSVLMVGFESGEIKFLDTNQVKLTRNDTLGIGASKPKFDFGEVVMPSWSMRTKHGANFIGEKGDVQRQLDEVVEAAMKEHRRVLAAKEEIVKAFVAKHQLEPDEAELIIQDIDAVTKRFYVRKKP